MVPIMIEAKLRGSRAYVSKPEHFVLNKIKNKHTSPRLFRTGSINFLLLRLSERLPKVRLCTNFKITHSLEEG